MVGEWAYIYYQIRLLEEREEVIQTLTYAMYDSRGESLCVCVCVWIALLLKSDYYYLA